MCLWCVTLKRAAPAAGKTKPLFFCSRGSAAVCACLDLRTCCISTNTGGKASICLQMQPVQRLCVSFMSDILRKRIWLGGGGAVEGEAYASAGSNHFMNGLKRLQSESSFYISASKMLTVHFQVF